MALQLSDVALNRKRRKFVTKHVHCVEKIISKMKEKKKEKCLRQHKHLNAVVSVNVLRQEEV